MCLFGWVCVAGCGLSLAAVNGGYSPAAVCGRILAVCGRILAVPPRCRVWALGAQASVAVARGFSCRTACGIFPGRGSSPCTLH